MSRTTFRFEAEGIAFELSGSEEFVRRNLTPLLPFVDRVAGARRKAAAQAEGGGGAATEGDTHDLVAWYDRLVPKGSRLSMQDHILVFAFWMRTFKKYIFTSEDIRRAFEDLGMTEPKSLLQILGTLKRDHNLILGTERRGEYMLNTTGIDRARRLLNIPAPKGGVAPREEAGPGAPSREEQNPEMAARAVLDI